MGMFAETLWLLLGNKGHFNVNSCHMNNVRLFRLACLLFFIMELGFCGICAWETHDRSYKGYYDIINS